ncbi:MAG TPA: serine/threonine-protein kinase, partial [Thermoanaerobaculia bacterium]|nr:serine/threonine-protein kinase [Thermoanaerobaculia bacterium]
AQIIDESGRGTFRQVASLLREGGAALAAAHHAGVIHRDVKPQNFFRAEVAGGRRFKLFDFGLARSTALDAPGITKLGMVVGTPAYMSPEQARGVAVDERSDLYSFAVVAYEALVGDPLVKSFDLGRIMVEILIEIPPPPSRAVPILPAEVDRLFEAALAKDRERRPSRVVDWAESVASCLDTLPDDLTGWT